MTPHAKKQVLVVALGTRDGTRAGTGDSKACLVEGMGNTLDRRDPHDRVANDAALPHPFAISLELGLHEREEAPVFDEQGTYGIEHRKDRGERHVTHGKVDRALALRCGHVNDIGPLKKGHPLVLPKRPVKLRVADVDGKDARSTAVEQAVGETTSGAANIEASEPPGINAEGVEAALELETPSTHIGKRALHMKLAPGPHLLACRGEAHAPARHLARQNGAQGVLL